VPITAPSVLTPREREVFDAVLRSETTRQIAASRGLRYQTIKNYLTTIYDKLGVANRIELCRRFAHSSVSIAPVVETVEADSTPSHS
jgi:DNA-binding NarL/FixJ family response regulator